MDEAPGPFPTITSTRKSSMAMYRSSSAALGRRWISSINKTSPSSRELRIEARSPACWIAGPDVTRIGTPSSLATIIESVVLPSPGGPASSIWSGGTPRFCAALRNSASWAFSRGWPIKLSSDSGRSSSSLIPSFSCGTAEITRSDSSAASGFCQPSSDAAQLSEEGPLFWLLL